MYGYIYLTENLINNKRYIGQHKSTYFDLCYYGSGVMLHKALKKYGKENFRISILEWCSSKEELDAAEIFHIQQHNAILSNNYYNIAAGGHSGNCLAGKTEEEKQLIVDKWRKSMSERTEEEKQATIEKTRKTFENKSLEEKHRISLKRSQGAVRANAARSPEEEQARVNKIIATRNNRTAEQKRETSQKHSDNNFKMWEEMTPEKLEQRSAKYKETRAKQTEERRHEISNNARQKTIEQLSKMTEEQFRERSKKFSNTWRNKSEEEKKIYSQQCRQKVLGKIWVTNGEQESLIHPDLLEDYILRGYVKARKKSYLKIMQQLSER